MTSLRPVLMDLLERGAPEPDHSDLSFRPVFILAPRSHLGTMFTEGVIANIPNVIAVIDDFSTEDAIFGVPRWSVHEFTANADNHANSIALDFSVEIGRAHV